ncbi:MAG: riboflavin biosynthesis protein RibF [Bacteroidetes bacterium HGW-Bacteroidetes-21]|jgi:riboflavin kinase/FMN adenylyltransferase|nr:MAG: riboflavin biosynthesis protein RibF [Bacteroidetes bacterium HGW-Bacteroidetes-21]
MKIFKSTETPLFTRPVITVGTFDGVHNGHRKVLQKVVEIANSTGGDSVVLTFWPHPRHVLGKTDFMLLNTLNEKIALLESCNIDAVIVYDFTTEFAKTTSYDFIKNILIDKYRIGNIVVGHDHHFGKMREGKYETLGNFSKEFGFKLFQVNPEVSGVNAVSSTAIRNELIEGNVGNARKMLSYPYHINGKVIDGFKLGKNIGFPTANIKVNETFKQIPGDGVYAATAQLMGKTYKGMINIGFRPTLNQPDPERSIEIHLFDFEENIYGHTIRIEFFEKLRNEVKFSGIEELKKQLQKDKVQAEKILAKE